MSIEMVSVCGDMISKLSNYESIGSIKEFNRLKEMQKPKAPIYGRVLGVLGCKCPSCGRKLYDSDWPYDVAKCYFHEICVFCGQKLTKCIKLGTWENQI